MLKYIFYFSQNIRSLYTMPELPTLPVTLYITYTYTYRHIIFSILHFYGYIVRRLCICFVNLLYYVVCNMFSPPNIKT